MLQRNAVGFEEMKTAKNLPVLPADSSYAISVFK